ncbi:MAG: hypothetical protein ACJA2M_001354 [Polaribacter sp.]|jgi:hypothetical protein
MFKTEQEMSLLFERFLKKNFGNSYLKECQGLFGIPDFVFYTKQHKQVSVISFELKLKNWKKAVSQAFRYKSFSDISYVVLPSESIKVASKNIKMFERYNIGLAKFDAYGNFRIIFNPELSTPYSDNLNRKLVTTINSSRKKTNNIESFVDKLNNYLPQINIETLIKKEELKICV